MSQESESPPKLNNDGLEANAKDVISPLPSSLTIIAPSSFVAQILKLWLSDIRLKFSIKLNVIKIIKKLINFFSVAIIVSEYEIVHSNIKIIL